MIMDHYGEYKSRGRSAAPRRGMILFVSLVMIALLAVLGASFSFRMNANLAAVQAVRQEQQARLAAWSGIDRALFLLRDHRTEVAQWYNNPAVFRRVIVAKPDDPNFKPGSESVADKEAIEGERAWRYSIVSYEMSDAEGKRANEALIRYGLTDEASKVNLNVASRAQLLRLFDQIDVEDTNPVELVDALIDWRDRNDEEVTDNGAESGYYMTLEPPYRAKNRWLETVEEILMVRGFNGRFLYGEDYNRNGVLDPNEDDGDEDGAQFPPDNGDGVLNRGLLPYITIYSWDWNRANDNKLRININQKGLRYSDKMAEYFNYEITEDVFDFISEAQKRGYKFRSVGELVDLEVFEDGSSNYDEVWAEYDKMMKEAKATGDEEESQDDDSIFDDDQQDDGQQDDDDMDDGSQDDGSGDGFDDGQGDDQGDGSDLDDLIDEDQLPDELKDELDKQGLNRKASRLQKRGDPNENNAGGQGQGGNNNQGGQNGGGSGGGRKPKEKGTPVRSPVTADMLPVLEDRLTAVDMPFLPGRINVNTAPREVLMTIPGLDEGDADAIISTRERLDSTEKATTAWLMTQNVLSDPKKYATISSHITARSIQFTIDAIGFADHVGVAKRIQVVVEMQGHLAQIKYYRDLTSLRIGYPLDEEAERRRGFATSGE